MAQRCTLCAHPRREDVDALLRGEHNVHELSRHFGVSRQAILRHRGSHLSAMVVDGELLARRRRAEQSLRETLVDWEDVPDTAAPPAPPPPAPPIPPVEEPATKPSPKPGKQNAQTAFLTSYAASGDLRQALKDAQATRTELRRWQEHDDEFSLRFHQADAEAVENLETEARIRAVAGSKMTRRVYRQGLLYEEIHEWRPSDAMLVKLLQAARPEKYTDKLTVTQTTVVKAVDADAWNSV